MKFGAVLDLLQNVEQKGKGYMACCPVHDDEHPSLSVSLTDEGRVLIKCWSAGCDFHDIVAAIGLTAADLRKVDADSTHVTTSTTAATPPTADQLGWLSDFIEARVDGFADSPGMEYAERRWGTTEAQARHLKLIYPPPGTSGRYIPYPWTTCGRIGVPLYGFDNVARGLQGRALGDDPKRWCSLGSPENSAWSRLGVLAHDHGDDYVQLGEGPGDGLTAYSAGTSAVFLRGTQLVNDVVINQLIAGCHGKVVILAGDADRSGAEFNLRLGEHLSEAGIDVRVLDLPDGVGDVPEMREAAPIAFPRQYAVALRDAPPFSPTPTPPPPAVIPSGRSYLGTHQGNAERLIDAMGGAFASCPQLGRLIFSNGYWQADELHHAVRAFSKITYEMIAEAEVLLEEGRRIDNQTLIDRGNALKAWARARQNEPHFSKSILRAEQLAAVPLRLFDTHKHLLNCRNGTVDLRTGVLRDHDRDDRITHRLDVDFDPDATCPRFDQFLAEIFPGDADMPGYLQRGCGYAATGETIEQCLVICIGIGANGKSCLWSTVQHVLGPLVGVVPFTSFDKRAAGQSSADLASLRGKRLALVMEGEASVTLSESTLKRATGGDAVSARHLYKSQMSFFPEFLIVMSSNHLPRIKGADESIWRRMRLVRFPRFFTDAERDPRLFIDLRAEAPGVLRWIVEGAKRWYADGLLDPVAVKAATRNYRSTSDELGTFIGMVVGADPEASIAGNVVMGAYLDFAVEENLHRPWSRRALYEGLTERLPGVSKVKKMDGIHLVGLRMATDEDRRNGDMTE